MDEKKHHHEVVQLGLKLSNFRRKLAAAIGEKKINQDEFGEMYGGYTGRQINSYETGSSPVASVLIFLLWENGHSIDALFAETAISEKGRESAARLYNEATLRIARQLDDEQQRWLEKELNDEKEAVNSAPHNHTPKTPTGGKKTSSAKTSPTKKRK